MKTINLLTFVTCVTLAMALSAPARAKHHPGHMANGEHDSHQGKMHHKHGKARHHDGDATAPGHGGHWAAPDEAARRPNPEPRSPRSVARGRELYAENCLACHGKSLRGDGPAAKDLRPPPQDLLAMVPGHPDGDLAWKIANGRGAMPAWKESLSERDIWDLVNFLKTTAATEKAKKSN